MMERYGSSPQAQEMLDIEVPVTLSVTVTADWTLNPDEGLVKSCYDLQQAVTDSDIANTQEEDALSPEQKRTGRGDGRDDE